MGPEKYYLYILQSIKDKGFYIGQTSDLDRRLELHNGGKVKSTRSRRPMMLIYHEEFCNRQEACRREWFLKHPKGYNEKLQILKSLVLPIAG